MKTLKTSRVRTVADMSDMDVFKTDLLKPILRVRDPGSDGNLAVQEVCPFAMDSAVVYYSTPNSVSATLYCDYGHRSTV